MNPILSTHIQKFISLKESGIFCYLITWLFPIYGLQVIFFLLYYCLLFKLFMCPILIYNKQGQSNCILQGELLHAPKRAVTGCVLNTKEIIRDC